MNLDEIKTLTVNDLKKELKARSLPVSGNKPDLIQRLSDYILANDDQILNQSDEGLLEGVHEDEILGISSDEAGAPKQPTPPKKATLKRDINQAVAIAPTAIITGDAPSTLPQQSAGGPQDDSAPEKDAGLKKIKLKTSTSTDSEKAATVTPKSPVTPVLDPEQKKIERAKKFNIPMPEDDRKLVRAERFGISNAADAAKPTQPTTLSATSASLDPELLQKRAQRFGMPVVKTSKTPTTATPVDNEKLKQRAERFGLQEKPSQGTNGVGNSGAADEKLLKRKMRFDGGGGGGTVSTGDSDASEKKKMRAERFGMK